MRFEATEKVYLVSLTKPKRNMRCVKTTKDVDNSVNQFIVKKEIEGKPKKVATMAGLNKFLRIYYARVKEAYQYEDNYENRPEFVAGLIDMQKITC